MKVDKDEDVEESTPLRTALFESVSRNLVADGFEFNVVMDKYFRRHDGITDHFQLVCKDAKPGYRIQPNVGVKWADFAVVWPTRRRYSISTSFIC